MEGFGSGVGSGGSGIEVTVGCCIVVGAPTMVAEIGSPTTDGTGILEMGTNPGVLGGAATTGGAEIVGLAEIVGGAAITDPGAFGSRVICGGRAPPGVGMRWRIC